MIFLDVFHKHRKNNEKTPTTFNFFSHRVGLLTVITEKFGGLCDAQNPF